jgi:hypothetical protein
MMHNPLRDGDLLMVRDGSLLPSRCTVCAAPAFAETATLRFSKSRHQARDGLVASLIGVAIDKLSDHVAGDHYTGPVSVRVQLCHVHAGWRRWLFMAGWVMLIVGSAGFLLTIFDRISPWIGLVCLMGGLIGFLLIVGIASGFLQLFLRSQRFDDRVVWLRGACPEFLADFRELRSLSLGEPDRAAACDRQDES